MASATTGRGVTGGELGELKQDPKNARKGSKGKKITTGKTLDTAKKLPKKPNPVPGNVPFSKGFDPRRNLHGRPEGFDELRALVREIGHTELSEDGLTRIASKILDMYSSKNPADGATLLAYGWGKVKDEIEIDDTGLTDDQRAKRIIDILDSARTRRDGQADSGDSAISSGAAD